MGGQLAAIILAMLLASVAARAANSDLPASSAASAVPAAPAPPVRIDPVPPEHPVSRKAKQQFAELFGQDLKAVTGSADGLTLAEKIFDEVRQGSHTPDFVGYGLDQVVSLASASVGGGLLAYNALGAQKSMSLRPRAGCLEKMLALGPRVLAELSSGRQADWLNKTFGHDAAEYAVLLAARGDGAGAARTLEAAAVAAAQASLSPPDSLDWGRAGVEFFKKLDDSISKAQADLAEPGDHPDARLLLGLARLGRDRKPADAAKQLRASGNAAAARLANALDMASGGAGGDLLALARAEATLAGETKELYFKRLLWQQADENLDRCLQVIDLNKDDRQEAMRLKDEAATWLAHLAGELPPVVAAELAAAAARPPELADEETESHQTFFGIPFRQAKRVVYLVDCSASAGGDLALVKAELDKSIAALAGEQNFSIVFCGSNSAQVLPGGLIAAGDDNKEAALKFIADFVPHGRANPKAGLTKAFALDPTVLCLLTDGDPGAAAVKQVADLNKHHVTVVHTFAFGSSIGAGVLREIAAANGGAYRFVGQPRAPSAPSAPMSAEDRDRLDRLIGYLEKNAGDPLPKLQKTIELAKNLLDKYGDGVPEPLRKRAEKVFARLGV